MKWEIVAYLRKNFITFIPKKSRKRQTNKSMKY